MSKTGAPRKQLNLNTLRAQRLEAKGAKDLEIVLDDETFTLPLANWWSLSTVKSMQALGDNPDPVALLEMLAGEEDTLRLIDMGLDLGDFEAIMKELQDKQGADLGESSGSSES